MAFRVYYIEGQGWKTINNLTYRAVLTRAEDVPTRPKLYSYKLECT